MVSLLIEATWETTYMVGISGFISAVLGIPLGIILVITSRGHIMENIPFNSVLGSIVNALRSTPFIILMVAIIPLTRLIVGTSIGTFAAIVPLSIAAIPFMGRIAETSLNEVNRGVIEAAKSMGASVWQIITKVLIRESLPGLTLGVTITIISLIGYSAMAGVIGGGGLGDLAIRYGYQRFQAEIMVITVIILIIQVQLVQSFGDYLAKKLNKK
jgi:D-methionine transport system permease protein